MGDSLGYESLPLVCFHCGQYGHMKEVCPHKSTISNTVKEMMKTDSSLENLESTVNETEELRESFGPWMLVERKYRHKSRETQKITAVNLAKNGEGSCFRTLIDLDQNNSTNSVVESG